MKDFLLPLRIVSKTIERYESSELSLVEDWAFIELLFQESSCLVFLEQVMSDYQVRGVFPTEKNPVNWYLKTRKHDEQNYSINTDKYQHGFLFQMVGEIIDAMHKMYPELLTNQQAS